jgi:hypothetical protein
MAVKKTKKKPRRLRRFNKNGMSVDELAAQLAPPEEQAGQAAIEAKKSTGNGAIIVDKSSLKIPASLDEEKRETARLFGLEPVVITILVISLTFIAFITYLIAHMPAR